MIVNKYELTDETIEYLGHILHRIKALKDFGDIKKGDLGGYIESERNLSYEGDCWVGGNAKVFDNAWIYNNAMVLNNAQVFGFANVYDNAKVYGKAHVFDHTCISGEAKVCGGACVWGNAKIYDNTKIGGKAEVFDKAEVYGKAEVWQYAKVYGNAHVFDHAWISHNSKIYDKAAVYGYAEIAYNAEVKEMGDYMVFQNNWSSGRHFTWTKSNDMWTVGCFYGTGEELIKKAYEDSYLKGENYAATVKYVKTLLNNSRVLWM